MREIPRCQAENPKAATTNAEYAAAAHAPAVLERNGIQQFDPAGEKFDPSEHEALSVREDGEPGLVLDVVEKGYRANGTVLRPARVVVSG